nr:thioredoxin domain-containing protein [Propionibacterium sp.]
MTAPQPRPGSESPAAAIERLERRLGVVRALAAVAAALGLVAVALAAFALARPTPVAPQPTASATATVAPTTLQMIRTGKPADAGVAPSGAIVLGAPGKGYPVLDIYEDFQCPACASVERTFGPQVDALLADGRIEVRYHMMSFLDGMLRNDSSVRAAAGGFCAHEQGKFAAWHGTLFANHPQTEGDGWTDAQLADFAKAAGLDVTAWSSCVASNKYAQQVTDANELSLAGGVNATPTYKLNGTKLDLQKVVNLGGLGKVVDANR